jgi:hypothetical protein
MKFRLLKTCIRGKRGDLIDCDLNDARQLAYHRIIDLDSPMVDPMPELIKVDQPIIRKRGRPKKNASNAAD